MRGSPRIGVGSDVGTVTVHNFSYGLLNPLLGYAMSCLGAFLGLRCVTRARAYTGYARARWLVLAAIAVGATGIWAMHFIAMLGFTIPGQQILYNVPLTIVSMLLAIVVVGIGLFIVGFSNGGPAAADHRRCHRRARGRQHALHGHGRDEHAGQHALQHAAVHPVGRDRDRRRDRGAVGGIRVQGIAATIGASLVMGVAVSGMHYTGMAAMRGLLRSAMAGMSGGSSASSFLVPLLLGISLVTFVLTLVISLSPTEDEIAADTALQQGTQPGTASANGSSAPGRRPAPRDMPHSWFTDHRPSD